MATTQSLTCPGCGASIPPDDVNIARLAAVCRGCNSLVDLSTQVLHRPVRGEYEG